MKKTYKKPQLGIIVIQDICSNGLNMASVQAQDRQTTIDNFEVVEQEQSKDAYSWDADSWGGN